MAGKAKEAGEDITAWKRALRRDMLAARAALSEEEHARRSAALCGHLGGLLASLAGKAGDRTLAFCWPIKREPDILPAVRAWLSAGGRAVLPVVVADDRPLSFRAWTPDTPMEKDRYGIPTPAAGAWLAPDVFLLPVNAFDAAGWRLGYGGGYFDRTLGALEPRPPAIGVGFEMNRVESLVPEPHDQRLDWIVTEAGAFAARA